MKLKMAEIVSAQNALRSLINQEIPTDIGWDIAVMMKKFSPELESFYEQRNKIVQKYGIIVEGTKDQYKFEGENGDKHNEEVRVLLEKEVEVEVRKVKLDDLNRNNVKMKPVELMALEWLIDK